MSAVDLKPLINSTMRVLEEKRTTTGDASNPSAIGEYSTYLTFYPYLQNEWVTYKKPPVVTLRQWLDLLAGIFGDRRCTPFDQMELLLCLKHQGFDI